MAPADPIGDVGCIREGHSRLLFSAGIPQGTRELCVDVSRTFEPLDVDHFIHGEIPPPGYLRTSTVREIGADSGAPSGATRNNRHPGSQLYTRYQPGGIGGTQLTLLDVLFYSFSRRELEIDHVTQARQAGILGGCLLRMVQAEAASSSNECLYHLYGSGENFGRLMPSQTAGKRNIDHFFRSRLPFHIQKSKPRRVRPNNWGYGERTLVHGYQGVMS